MRPLDGATRAGALREGALRDGATRVGALREGPTREGVVREGETRLGAARDDGAARPPPILEVAEPPGLDGDTVLPEAPVGVLTADPRAPERVGALNCVGEVALDADPLDADVLDGEATRDEPADLDGDAALDDVVALGLAERDAAAPLPPRRRSLGRAPLDTLAPAAAPVPDRTPRLDTPP